MRVPRGVALELSALVAIGVIAFLVRLLPVLRGGGLGGYGRYDDGVYYSAADALIHGRWPYRDYVLLHPPGIAVALAPFAAVGSVTSDRFGFEAARIAFMLIGALNAVLVALLARRWGWGAGLTAGAVYAVWWPAVYAEESTVLEPLGSTALLVALLLLLNRRSVTSRRAALMAGFALGAATTVKIWYLAPWVAICGWQLVARRWRTTWHVALSGTATVALLLLPFAVVARSRMYDMVIRDQLLRPGLPGSSRSGRLKSIFGLPTMLPRELHLSVTTATRVVLVVLVVAVTGCLADRGGRVLVYVLAVNFAVLIASPSFFMHYAHLVAAPVALVLGVGLARVVRGVGWGGAGRLGIAVAVIACGSLGYRIVSIRVDRPANAALLARAAPPGCVASDNPELVILMNRLSRDLSIGCRVAVDVSGVTYDFARRTDARGTLIPRSRNPAWNRYLYSYLVAARSFVFIRPDAGVAVDTVRALESRPVLAASDGVTLRAGDG